MGHPAARQARRLTSTLPFESRGGLRAVARDAVFWTGAVVWFLSLLPSLVPVLPPDPTFYWAAQYNDVPILLVAVAAMAIAWHRADGGREQVFWALLMGSPATSLVARFLWRVVPYEGAGVLSDQTIDLAYLLGYVCMVLALELRPEEAGDRPARPQQVERLGMLLYGLFLLSYFTLAPSIFRPELYATWVPSMLLFAVMDTYLLARTWWLLRHGIGPPWAPTFRWLRAVFLLWLAGDLVEGLMYMNVIPYVDAGTPLDLLWMAPGLLLVVVGRSHRRTPIPARPRG